METIRTGQTAGMNKKRTVLTSAGGYLVRKNEAGEYEMLIIHEKWKKGNETYMLPKGRSNPSESLEETAKREITEETGYCEFELIRYIGSRTYELDWDEIYIKTDHYYLVLLKGEKKVEQNMEDYEKEIRVADMWVGIDKGFEMLTYDGEKPREFLKIIKESLRGL